MVEEQAKEKIEDKKEILYDEPAKTLKEARARVGSEIKLNGYGLVEEPDSLVENISFGFFWFFAIAGAIILNIFFYGKIVGSFIDAIVLGLAGFVFGGDIGAIFGRAMGELFVSKKRKQKDSEAKAKCRELNKKYNLRKIVPPDVEGCIDKYCPECGADVEIINTEERVGYIGNQPAKNIIRTVYKCKDCGFMYYSNKSTAKKEHTEWTRTKYGDGVEYDHDFKRTVYRDEDIEYGTDEKCSVYASVALRRHSKKQTVNETKEKYGKDYIKD